MHLCFVNRFLVPGKFSCTNSSASCHVLTPSKSCLKLFIALSKLWYLHMMVYMMTNYSSHVQDYVQSLGLALLYKALSLLRPKELNYAEAI